jgi:hypothetical protein
MSPLEMILGFQPLFPLWQLSDMSDHMAASAEPSMKERLLTFRSRQQAARHSVFANNAERRVQYKDEEDKHAVPHKPLLRNQPVWIRNHAPAHRNRKLAPKWLSAVVIEQTAAYTYRVRIVPGKSNKSRLVTAEHIKPRIGASNEQPDDDSEQESRPLVTPHQVSRQQALPQPTVENSDPDIHDNDTADDQLEEELADDLNLKGPMTRAKRKLIQQVMAIHITDSQLEAAIEAGELDLRNCMPHMLAAMRRPRAHAPDPAPIPPPPPPPLPAKYKSPSARCFEIYHNQETYVKNHWRAANLPDFSGLLVQADTGLVRVTTATGVDSRLAASVSRNVPNGIHPLALEAARSTAKSRYPTLEKANSAFSRCLENSLAKARASRATSNAARARAQGSSKAEKAAILARLNTEDMRAEDRGLPTYHPQGPIHPSHVLFFGHDKITGLPLINAGPAFRLNTYQVNPE